MAVHYASKRDLAEEVAQQITAMGRRAVVVGGDVSQREAVDEMVARVQGELGPIDILVSNAATFLQDTPIWEISESQWDRIFGVNVKGPLFAAQAVIPSMQARRSGAILNISSLGGEVTMSGMGAYTSGKGAINALTRQMALELAPWNIRVNALAPGHIDTPDNLRWITADPEREARFRARIALGRLGKMEEMGRTAVFLVSDDASYVTGQVLHAEGGIMFWQGPIV